MVDLDKLAATSRASGFKNYAAVYGSDTIPSQTLLVGQHTVLVINIALNNSNAVSLHKLRYSSVESFWRQMQGWVSFDDIVTGYSLQTTSFYESGFLKVVTFAVNQTGSDIVLPAQFIEVKARLHKAPF